MEEFGLNTIILQSVCLKKLVQKGEFPRMARNQLNGVISA